MKFTTAHKDRHQELPVNFWRMRTSKMKQYKSKTSRRCSMLRTLSISRWTPNRLIIRSTIRDGLLTTERKLIRTSWGNFPYQNMLHRDGSTRVNSSQTRTQRSSSVANSQARSPHWCQKSEDLLITSLTLMQKKNQKRREIKQYHRHRKNSLKCMRKNWNALCKVKRV